MKAILEFNLPDEQVDFELASKAHAWHSVVWELDQWLRTNAKYGEDSVEASKVRDHLCSLMNDENIGFAP